MDPFKQLPPELRLDILVHTRSKRRILPLIGASPIMLDQYIKSKGVIVRKILRSDLDDEMIQDAVGIVMFPSHDPSRNYLTSYHFVNWKKQQLPNPLRKENHKLNNELERLYARLLLFIEDYLTKATAIYPPREFLCLPDLSLHGRLLFRDQEISLRFDAADLTCSERKRLFRAFLRYEILCKIQRRLGVHTSLSYADMNRKMRPSEQEAIHCIHSYLKSLYGAIFAQFGYSWLPDIPSDSLPSLTTTRLLYPDCFYVDADLYASELIRHFEFTDHQTSCRLACYGLDLVTTFVRYATLGLHGLDCIRIDLRNFDGLWHDDFSCHINGTHCPNDLDVQQYEETSGVYEQFRLRISASSELLRDIYRQRAWVFLENMRLYPSSGALSHFPTENELQDQADDTRLWEECFSKSINMRQLHRSQKWHDELRGILIKGLVGRKYPGSNWDCECLVLGLDQECECQIPDMEMKFDDRAYLTVAGLRTRFVENYLDSGMTLRLSIRRGDEFSK